MISRAIWRIAGVVVAVALLSFAAIRISARHNP